MGRQRGTRWAGRGVPGGQEEGYQVGRQRGTRWEGRGGPGGQAEGYQVDRQRGTRWAGRGVPSKSPGRVESRAGGVSALPMSPLVRPSVAFRWRCSAKTHF